MTIGQKIKLLRQSRGVSQLDLEVGIDSGAGSLSRIESDKVNPTKETLLNISNYLQLTPAERMYVLEITNQPPTQAEIEAAVKDLSSRLEDDANFGYVLDQYSTMVAQSNGFKSTLGQFIDTSKLIGKTIVEILFNPDLGIRGLLDQDHFEQIAIPAIALLHQERQHLLSESRYQEVLTKLNQLPEFREIYEKATREKIDLYAPRSQTVYFKFGEQVVKAVYNIVTYFPDPRFSYIQYQI